MPIFSAISSVLPTNREATVPRAAQSAASPRVLIFHPHPDSAQTLHPALLPWCSALQIVGNFEEVQGCLTQQSWDVLVVHLDPYEKSGIEALRFVQGCGLLLARIALMDCLDPLLLAAVVPLDVDALLLPPYSPPHLRETIERCFVRVLDQRRQARVQASMEDQIVHLKENRKQLLAEMKKLDTSVIEALLASLAMREADCVLHGLRVQAYASYFARLVGYPESLLPHLERAALLHDIGKIGLSDALLFRAGVFNPTDVERMQSHAAVGEQILQRIHFLQPAAQIVRHHHERVDGLGFPMACGEKVFRWARAFFPSSMRLTP